MLRNNLKTFPLLTVFSKILIPQILGIRREAANFFWEYAAEGGDFFGGIHKTFKKTLISSEKITCASSWGENPPKMSAAGWY